MMSTFEIIFAVSCVAVAAGGLLYIQHLVATSGRDLPHDPAAVERFVDGAWINRLRSGEITFDDLSDDEKALYANLWEEEDKARPHGDARRQTAGET